MTLKEKNRVRLQAFVNRSLGPDWQRENFYKNVRIEDYEGKFYVLMTTIKGHALGAGKKFFYDSECDFCFEFSRWINNPDGRKHALRLAMESYLEKGV